MGIFPGDIPGAYSQGNIPWGIFLGNIPGEYSPEHSQGMFPREYSLGHKPGNIPREYSAEKYSWVISPGEYSLGQKTGEYSPGNILGEYFLGRGNLLKVLAITLNRLQDKRSLIGKYPGRYFSVDKRRLIRTNMGLFAVDREFGHIGNLGKVGFSIFPVYFFFKF